MVDFFFFENIDGVGEGGFKAIGEGISAKPHCQKEAGNALIYDASGIVGFPGTIWRPINAQSNTNQTDRMREDAKSVYT